MPLLEPNFKPPSGSSIWKLDEKTRASLLVDIHLNRSAVKREFKSLYEDNTLQNDGSRILKLSKLREGTSDGRSVKLFEGAIEVSLKNSFNKANCSVNTLTPGSNSNGKSKNDNALEPIRPDLGSHKEDHLHLSATGPSVDKINGTSREIRTFNKDYRNSSALNIDNEYNRIQDFCRNIGTSEVSLSAFKAKIKDTSSCTLAIIWSDKTTNHACVAKKYCTPSSSCDHWNCICDKHLRVQRAFTPCLGALLLLEDSEPSHIYFLPLSLCLNEDCSNSWHPPYEELATKSTVMNQQPALESSPSMLSMLTSTARMSSNKDNDKIFRLPLSCSTSLEQRWRLLLDILTDPNIQKVTYNANVWLLPCMAVHHDLYLRNSNEEGKIYAQANAYNGNGVHESENNILNNCFDIKLAAHVLDSNITESEMELENLAVKYHADNCTLENLPPSDQFTVTSESGREVYADQVQRPVDTSAPSPRQPEGMGQTTALIYSTLLEMKKVHKIYKAQRSEMQATDVWRVFSTVEQPLSALLTQMELRGVAVSAADMEILEAKIRSELHRISLAAADLMNGYSFNLSSADQVAHVLYDRLKLPASTPQSNSSHAVGSRKEGKRHASTSEESLLKIKDLHPLVGMILEYRSLSKVLGTFISGLKPFMYQSTPVRGITSSQKRSTGETAVMTIHANWNQTQVLTGRLSCSRPNLQNIPNTTKTSSGLVLNPRGFFHPHPHPCWRTARPSGGGSGRADGNGNVDNRSSYLSVLVSADYSQLEMRVLAHACRDPNMTALFCRGYVNAMDSGTPYGEDTYSPDTSPTDGGDIYRHLAGMILNKSPAAVTDQERERAKVICLGVIYGMGPQAAAAKLDLDVPTVIKITTDFFAKFSRVRMWLNRVKELAKQCGYVTTLLGRRRYLPGLYSPVTGLKAQAERQSVNSIIQGSASEIVKVAMLLMERELRVLDWKRHWAKKQGSGVMESTGIASTGIASSPISSFDSQGCNSTKPFVRSPHDGGGQLTSSQSFSQGAPGKTSPPPPPQLLMQIHDEVIYEVFLAPPTTALLPGGSDDKRFAGEDRETLPLFISLLKDCMERRTAESLHLEVPLKVNVKVGRNWGALEKYE